MKSAKRTWITSGSECDRHIHAVSLSYSVGITVDSQRYQVFITQTLYLGENKGWVLCIGAGKECPWTWILARSSWLAFSGAAAILKQSLCSQIRTWPRAGSTQISCLLYLQTACEPAELWIVMRERRKAGAAMVNRHPFESQAVTAPVRKHSAHCKTLQWVLHSVCPVSRHHWHLRAP